MTTMSGEGDAKQKIQLASNVGPLFFVENDIKCSCNVNGLTKKKVFKDFNCINFSFFSFFFRFDPRISICALHRPYS